MQQKQILPSQFEALVTALFNAGELRRVTAVTAHGIINSKYRNRLGGCSCAVVEGKY